MKTFEVRIEEILSKYVKVKAESEEDAVDIAEWKYRHEEIVLYPEDFEGHEITAVREIKEGEEE